VSYYNGSKVSVQTVVKPTVVSEKKFWVITPKMIWLCWSPLQQCTSLWKGLAIYHRLLLSPESNLSSDTTWRRQGNEQCWL